MEELSKRIEALEITEDNAEYRRSAKQFVHTLLPEGADGARFGIPPEFTQLTQIRPSTRQLLHFSDLPY